MFKRAIAIAISSMGLVLPNALVAGADASTAAPAAVTPTALAVEVSCRDNGCDGKLPEVQGCDNDATTLYTAVWPGHRLISFDLRFSQACQAVWGRIRDNRNDINTCDNIPAVRVQSRIYDPLAGVWRIRHTEARHMTMESRCFGNWAWTRMVGRANSQERLQWGRWSEGFGFFWHGGSGWDWPA